MDVREYAEARGLSLSVVGDLERQPYRVWNGRTVWHYKGRVVLEVDGRTMETDWSQGEAHGGAAPEAADVLNALILDAGAGELDFPDFAEEYGYESPREAYETWQACQRIARELPDLLGGPEEYERARELEGL